MKRQTIGRNKPCPCGSGKKYKNCCYGKNTDSKVSKYHILPDYDKIDYNNPILNDNFFKSNTVQEISAPRFLYSTLLMPEAESIATQISKRFINRGEEERKTIEAAEDVNTLINIMDQKPDSLNHVKLVKKLLQFKEVSIPLILEELKKPKNNEFIEISVKIIHGSGKNYSNEILEIIKYYQRDPYAVFQLCMLLGFSENKKSAKVLWDYFHFFKEHFKNEAYCDGPLLGLIEMRERKKEKLFRNRYNKKNITSASS